MWHRVIICGQIVYARAYSFREQIATVCKLRGREFRPGVTRLGEFAQVGPSMRLCFEEIA
jgi:hypothetical protein